MRNAFFKVLLWIFICLFTVSLIWKLLHGGSDTFLFSSFLEFCSNLKSFSIDTSAISFTIDNSWGVFNFLRDFFNGFSKIFTYAVFLFNQLLNLLYFAFQFIAFLFV